MYKEYPGSTNVTRPYVIDILVIISVRHNDRDGVSQSSTSRWFVQPFVQAQINENIKAPYHLLCEGNPVVTGGFPSQNGQ